MCTITFMPRRQGYRLGMNRDEKRSRAQGLAPTLREIHGCRVLYPSEPTGGTWIALNERGISFALINWYSVAAGVDIQPVSRGVIIPSICAAASVQSVDAGLIELPLDRINPFRLIGVFPGSRQVMEWRWNLEELTRNHRRWRARQWISSGFDEPKAQRIRNKAFREALSQNSAGSLDWLRRLHRSHSPRSGPFSICMHRDDAATVSYTELCFSAGRSEMRYARGSACGDSGMLSRRMGR